MPTITVLKEISFSPSEVAEALREKYDIDGSMMVKFDVINDAFFSVTFKSNEKADYKQKSADTLCCDKPNYRLSKGGRPIQCEECHKFFRAEEVKHLAINADTKIYMETWTESEAGWGTRPDGASIHASKEAFKIYMEEYWSRQPTKVPSEYSRPDQNLKEYLVPITVLERLGEKSGIRLTKEQQGDIEAGFDPFVKDEQ